MNAFCIFGRARGIALLLALCVFELTVASCTPLMAFVLLWLNSHLTSRFLPP